MLAGAGYGIQRGFALRYLDLNILHPFDTQTLADTMVGALTGGIVNWTVDKTYSLESGLHALAVALADLLGADANGWMRPSGCCGKYRTRASRCDRSPSAPRFSWRGLRAHDPAADPRGVASRRVRTALRSGAWPEVAETLEFGLLGALVHASCGADTFRQTAEGLAGMVAIVLPDR